MQVCVPGVYYVGTGCRVVQRGRSTSEESDSVYACDYCIVNSSCVVLYIASGGCPSWCVWRFVFDREGEEEGVQPKLLVEAGDGTKWVTQG